MKKGKEFHVGDKVFAKVKGYPAWPAIIIEDQTTKYNVKFYGTGETGIVKSKDLFYYLKHKDTFVKSIKRKDYKDAIEEIERAIEDCGTDGNNEDSMSSTNANDSISSNKINKRKRSMSSDKSGEVPIKKKLSTGTDSDDGTTSVPIEELEENNKEKLQVILTDKENLQPSAGDLNSKGDLKQMNESASTQEKCNYKVEMHINKSQSNANETINEDIVKVESPMEDASNESEDTVELSINDVIPVYLHWILAYADHVKKNKDMYMVKSVEKRPHSNNEVVFAKMPSGKYVAIKYNRDDIPEFESEFERAEYDESIAKNALSLKNQIENGTYKAPINSELFETQLKVNETQIKQALDSALVQRKKARLELMKRETRLIELDAIIKSCLGLDKAEPKAALDYLDVMLQLDIEPLMLKKQPAVVDMIKRLRRYIGNVKEWDLNNEQLEEFQQDAKNIREKAITVYTKFANLFNVKDETLFWELYSREAETFKKLTAHMPENEVMLLTDEPDCRQSFMDRMCEEEAAKSLESNRDASQNKSEKVK